ncbi:MAG: hypothetical protein GYB50_00115 [Rhodobacteraceae bacterium]|nr:hypothetical protein [Salipiger thiooxidans]MBR9836277.1 hypothetical protein [Paracoccaceae bacterium]
MAVGQGRRFGGGVSPEGRWFAGWLCDRLRDARPRDRCLDELAQDGFRTAVFVDVAAFQCDQCARTRREAASFGVVARRFAPGAEHGGLSGSL